MTRESDQPFDSADAQRFAATETEEGQMKFLQAALQESFATDIAWDEFEKADLIIDLARQHSVEVDIKTALQNVYEARLSAGWESGCKQIKEYSHKKSINTEFDAIKDRLESERANTLQPQNIAPEVATDEPKKIDDTPKSPRERFEMLLAGSEPIWNMGKILAAAKEQNIELFSSEQAAQTVYANLIRGGNLDSATSISQYAKENGLVTNVSIDDLQKGFDIVVSTYWIDNFDKWLDFANEKNIKLNVSPEKAQAGYDHCLSLGRIDYDDRWQQFAHSHGVALTVSPEKVQAGFESILQGKHGKCNYRNIREDMETFEQWCQKKDIKLNNINKVKQQTYIQIIHDPDVAHAQHLRAIVLKFARDNGLTLTYEEVAKMDYLKELNVPDEQQLRQTTETHVDGHPITVRLYGQRQDEPMEGKFIVGITPDKGLELVFDGTLGEHGDIGVKYDLQVIGGGWLKIDEQEKRVTISKKSQDFGFDPRSITTKALTEAFPGYAIETE